MGFYTNRFVDAETAEAAELAAVELLRQEPKLRALLNSRDDPPVIYAEEITEAAAALAESRPDQGFAFYVEENDS